MHKHKFRVKMKCIDTQLVTLNGVAYALLILQ